MTLTLNKSISATHLNTKTGVPSSEGEHTISYGAVIKHIGSDRGNERFTHMGQLYRCPKDVLASALDGGKIPQEAAASPKASSESTPATAAAPAVQLKLKFEPLRAGSYNVARAKVPGGWLIALGSGVTFYPDTEHAWDGESLA